MISVAEVRAVLNSIVDPCSAAAGVPAGLCDMGLVHAVAVRDGPAGRRVEITLGVTEPGCFMVGSFAAEARSRLLALDDVDAVDLTLDEGFDWSEEAMNPAYRTRLAAHRASGRSDVSSTGSRTALTLRPSSPPRTRR